MGVPFRILSTATLRKEVVALANFQSGVILLGVEDDVTITGIQRENLEECVMDRVLGRQVHRMIPPFFETVQVIPLHTTHNL